MKAVQGANGLPFENAYWRDIYGDGFDVDGTFNAREHAAYLRSLFLLMGVNVRSILDVGFGKGVLLKEFARAFQPEKITALDPSQERISEMLRKKWITRYRVAVQHQSIQDFKVRGTYSLVIFNSVAQYIEGDLRPVFKKLAGCSRFVYFSVPTDNDYTRMKKEIRFSDPYAHRRSRAEYLKALSPWFNIVSWNLLERKGKSQAFADELFIC